MEHSILLAVEQLPATGQNLVKTRINGGRLQSDGITRQNGRRCVQQSNLRSTALQLQVDVQHVELVDQTDTFTLVICLVVGVLINDADDLLLGDILGIRLARDIERG